MLQGVVLKFESELDRARSPHGNYIYERADGPWQAEFRFTAE
jgi:hypothetical protein